MDNSDDGRPYDPTEPAQSMWLGSATNYVTLSISGNDANSVPILMQCSFGPPRKFAVPSAAFTEKCNKAISAGFDSVATIDVGTISQRARSIRTK